METSKTEGAYNTNQKKGMEAGGRNYEKMKGKLGNWSIAVSGLMQISDWLLLLDSVQEVASHRGASVSKWMLYVH